MKSIFKVLLCVCALSVGGAGAADAGPKEDAIAAYDKGNYKRAARLFEPLAEQGDALAQFKLGVMYDDGKGVKKDDIQAESWCLKAAAGLYALAGDRFQQLRQSKSPHDPITN